MLFHQCLLKIKYRYLKSLADRRCRHFLLRVDLKVINREVQALTG